MDVPTEKQQKDKKVNTNVYMAVREGCKEYVSGRRLVKCRKCRKKVLDGEGLHLKLIKGKSVG